MKFIKRNITIFILLLISAPFSHSVEVRLKLSGGLSYLSFQNINLTLNHWAELEEKLSTLYDDWNFVEKKVKKFHSAFDFEGEIIIFITPHLAAGFGTGYIYGELTEEKTKLTVENNGVKYVMARPTKVSAIPISVSGYFFLPLKKNLHSFIKAGSGVLWAKYTDRQGEKEILEEEFNYTQTQRAMARGLFYQASIGLVYEIEPTVRFFIESTARLAKIKEFQEETVEENPGTLFYFEEYNPQLDFWQAQHRILSEEPSGENFRSVRKAVIDFNGFSVKIGVMIKF